ncbi:MAG: DUF1565 domain-containing protein [Candidatus Limnocylindrales bacterium]
MSTRRLRAAAASVAASFALMATLAAAGPVAAATPHFYVATSGSDANACSWSHPCKTISHAVNVAPAGSRIDVLKGTYHEQVFVTKRLTLVGHHATIDASGLLGGLPPLNVLPPNGPGIIGMAVLILGPGASGTVFRDFRVMNAPAEGILAALTSRVQLLDNELLHNDVGATTPFTPLPGECAAQGNVPGDCGEALHLLSTTKSRAAFNNVHDNVGGFLLTDEVGPNRDNVIAFNVSKNNKLDCGITLPSHNPDAVADPSKGGVYDNLVIGNWSVGNGGAGVGMFAPFPGAASYDNRVIANYLAGNGEAGIAIHSHAPGQNVSGNVIAGNVVSGNGVDPDFVDLTTKIGIMLGSVADTVNVTVAGNWISHQDVGIYRVGTINVAGLASNHFGPSVPVHVK